MRTRKKELHKEIQEIMEYIDKRPDWTLKKAKKTILPPENNQIALQYLYRPNKIILSMIFDRNDYNTNETILTRNNQLLLLKGANRPIEPFRKRKMLLFNPITRNIIQEDLKKLIQCIESYTSEFHTPYLTEN